MRKYIYAILLLFCTSSIIGQINLPPAKGYVDLGLPSGTKWKELNEEGFFTHDEALTKYGPKLPSADQWRELATYCEWEWQGSGFLLTSVFNKNSLFLPSDGFIKCNGVKETSNSFCSYWTRDKFWNSSAGAYVAWSYSWYYYDSSANTRQLSDDRLCFRFHVRLVQQ